MRREERGERRERGMSVLGLGSHLTPPAAVAGKKERGTEQRGKILSIKHVSSPISTG